MPRPITSNDSPLPITQPEANKKALILTSVAGGAVLGAVAGVAFGPIGILAGAVAGAVVGAFAALATFAINALMDRASKKQVEPIQIQAVPNLPQSNAKENAAKILSVLESRLAEVTEFEGLGRVNGNNANINKLVAGENVPEASVNDLFLALKRIFNTDVSILQDNLKRSDYARIQNLIDDKNPSAVAEIVKLLNPENASLTVRYIRLLNEIAKNAENNKLTSYALNLSGFNMQITRTLSPNDQISTIGDEKEKSPKPDEGPDVIAEKASKPRVGAFIIENADAIVLATEKSAAENRLNELSKQAYRL